MAEGMQYLASKKIVHKDLAARNCMYDLWILLIHSPPPPPPPKKKHVSFVQITRKTLLFILCRLGENMVIKVADFGFSENMYTRAYVRTVVDGGVKLPVKWMAPESLLDGVFSEKTDVVCYYFVCCYSLVDLSCLFFF